MMIAIADTHLTALLAMREARDRWESECAGNRAFEENRAWRAALSASERAALDGWEADVQKRLAALMADADRQPVAAPDDAQAEPSTWPQSLSLEIACALLNVADAGEDVIDEGGGNGPAAELFDDAYDRLCALLGTTHGELRRRYDPLLQCADDQPIQEAPHA